jgi:hypothetical protein
MGKIFRPLVLRNGRRVHHVVAFIDCGSDTTVLSRPAAKALRLRPHGISRIALADGRLIETDIAHVSIESPRDGIKSQFTVDITNVPFDEGMDEVDMIIGTDFLQENNIKLIFQKSYSDGRKGKSLWKVTSPRKVRGPS